MHQLNMKQEFKVPASKVYAAWTKKDLIKNWFAPGDMTVPEAEVDMQVGGKYRIVMQEADGTQYIVGGTYLEINANEKLVFSWKWEHGEATTRVEVLFKDLGGNNSSLELIHSEFLDQESCDHHNEGWQGCLINLPKAL